ncbi:hypothetical protein [Niveibacterium terrae]|uniref:hypothetical protein n=1 Tax=Niveibacterium terrae TaxID=3373598 RepID=UPI003A8CB235
MRFTAFFLLALTLALPASAAEQILCHVEYGGETRELRAAPVSSPYAVAPTAIGSYFLFRVVFERSGSVKLYTYADREQGPVPIHVAEYQRQDLRPGRYGFTGVQTVYEPLRDGELKYWCELVGKAAR